jgi:hypothetical protein
MISKQTIAIAATALLAACTTTQWTVDKYQAPEADVAAQRSFAWRAGEIGAPLIRRPEVSADAERQVRAAVTAELQRKGYVEVSETAGADMVVSYQVTGARRFVETDSGRIGAPSPNQVLTPGNVPPLPASELPGETSVRSGTVVVFADDAASGRLMWRGALDLETRASSMETVVRQVVDVARHITQEFPARHAKP